MLAVLKLNLIASNPRLLEAWGTWDSHRQNILPLLRAYLDACQKCLVHHEIPQLHQTSCADRRRPAQRQSRFRKPMKQFLFSGVDLVA